MIADWAEAVVFVAGMVIGVWLIAWGALDHPRPFRQAHRVRRGIDRRR